MPVRHKRNLVRVLVGAALCMALLACFAAPMPSDLPAVALRQPGLYRLEIALLAFYGGLLFITPAFWGLISGQLPTEISTRGARFAEEADQSTELNDSAMRDLEQEISQIVDELSEATVEIERLKREGDIR